MPSVQVPQTYNFQAFYTPNLVSTIFVDTFRGVAAHADGRLYVREYVQQLNTSVRVGTVGGGLKIQSLYSTNNGATWTVGGGFTLLPTAFDNKTSFVTLPAGVGNAFIKIQVAAVNASAPPARITLDVCAFSLESYPVI